MEDEFRAYRQTVDSLFTHEYVMTFCRPSFSSKRKAKNVVGCAVGDFDNNPKIYIIKKGRFGEPEVVEMPADSCSQKYISALNYITEDFQNIKEGYLGTIPNGSVLLINAARPECDEIKYSMLFTDKETNCWFYWVRNGAFDFMPNNSDPPTLKILTGTVGILSWIM